MSRIKIFQMMLICLVIVISGIQNACATPTEPTLAATEQPSSSPPTITPTETPPPTTSVDLIINVPNGNPPALDGTISPDEWNGARQELFSDGSELLLMHHEGFLYVGIRANPPDMILGNIFIGQENQISILHSSAALGTAIYEKRSDTWDQIQAFSWRCRSSSDSPSAIAEREAFLQDEHWVANNSRIGAPQELEYKIAMPTGSLRLAVTFTRASVLSKRNYWPISLEDDSTKQPQGEYPTSMKFSPSTWMTVLTK